jgi:hypothetical protein
MPAFSCSTGCEPSAQTTGSQGGRRATGIRAISAAPTIKPKAFRPNGMAADIVNITPPSATLAGPNGILIWLVGVSGRGYPWSRHLGHTPQAEGCVADAAGKRVSAGEFRAPYHHARIPEGIERLVPPSGDSRPRCPRCRPLDTVLGSSGLVSLLLSGNPNGSGELGSGVPASVTPAHSPKGRCSTRGALVAHPCVAAV